MLGGFEFWPVWFGRRLLGSCFSCNIKKTTSPSLPFLPKSHNIKRVFALLPFLVPLSLYIFFKSLRSQELGTSGVSLSSTTTQPPTTKTNKTRRREETRRDSFIQLFLIHQSFSLQFHPYISSNFTAPESGFNNFLLGTIIFRIPVTLFKNKKNIYIWNRLLLPARWKCRRWIWCRQSSRGSWTCPTCHPSQQARSLPLSLRTARLWWFWLLRSRSWSAASSYWFGVDPTGPDREPWSRPSRWSWRNLSSMSTMAKRRSQSSSARRPVLPKDSRRLACKLFSLLLFHKFSLWLLFWIWIDWIGLGNSGFSWGGQSAVRKGHV